jgi:hypothetical protein
LKPEQALVPTPLGEDDDDEDGNNLLVQFRLPS